MSRAFIKEDVPVPEELSTPSLVAPLPEGAVNYVTPRGKRLLGDSLQAADAALLREPDPARQTSSRQSLEELRFRTLSAKVIDLSSNPPQQVRFGATVTLQNPDGISSVVTLVGVDEADPASGRISFYSALAQGLLGHRAGDTISISSDERDIHWLILSVSYANGTA
jgi:transcription elongation factor GreB